MPNWGNIIAVTAGVAVVGGMVGGMVYLLNLDSDYREERRKIYTQEDRAGRICYKIADTNNDGLTSIEEKVEMWNDMGWQVEEYMQDGAKHYKPVDTQEGRTYEEQIQSYEIYMQDHGYEFEYSYEEGYKIYQDPKSLRK